MKIAIIDLGSASARMTIWKITGDKSIPIYNERKFVRLSENIEKDNLLKKEAVDRTLNAISEFSLAIKKENCTLVRFVATEALRRAKNGRDFLDLVSDKFNLNIDILSGADEAKYDFLASKELISLSDAVLMDVGGGSLEIIRVEKGLLKDSVSLPLGAVVMTDRFHEDIDALISFFNDSFKNLPLISHLENINIIGLGGSIRALFDYSVGKEQGAVLDFEKFCNFFTELSHLPLESLKEISAFSDRFDILIAGLTPFYVLGKMLGSKKITLNNKGVREGILYECMNKINP